jgi:hypothetical protein
MFSDNETIDYFEIMALVDSFVEANSASIAINEDKLFSMIKRIHADFPCINGANNANVFKKSAAFLCEFVGEQVVETFECVMSAELFADLMPISCNAFKSSILLIDLKSPLELMLLKE